MIFTLAAVLTLGINFEVNLGALVQRQRQKTPTATCGIKVVGYHFSGAVGQSFRYGGESYTIPAEGFVDLISLPRVNNFAIEGRTLPFGEGPLDPFSFRSVPLPSMAQLRSQP